MFSKQDRIYYEDTDASGVVYHAKYLSLMERCRCDWLDSIGFNVTDLQELSGIIFVVREVKLQFERPARLFDQITVTAKVLQVGKVSLLLEQKIYNGDVLLCQAIIKLATLQASSFKLTSIPEALRQNLLQGVAL